MSTFSGINSALTALQAQRKAMDVIGQNVANAATPGYTRQRAELQEVVGTGTPSLFAQPRTTGDGVTVTTISRAHDGLLAARVDAQTADHAFLAGRADTLAGVESLTNEPGANGLAAQLDTMWAAWSDAGTKVGTAGDGAARQVVLQASQTVVDTLRTAVTGVQQLWDSQRAQAQADVTEVNTAAANIADLNDRIQKAVVTGGTANELMDQRDQLVTRLAELTGSTAQPGPNGQVDVLLGGSALVQGGHANRLVLTAPTSVAGASAASVRVSFADGASAAPASGSLAAAVEALGTTLPGAVATYDAIAAQLASDVNGALTAAGGTALFGSSTSPVTAAGLYVATTRTSDLVLGDPSRGATDGSVAKGISDLGTSKTGADALWSAHVADLASRSSAAAMRAGNAQSTLTAAVTDQQGQSGVSLDEETANLISAQRAYQGAARVLTAVDEMLDVLINKTGLVGR